MARSRPQLSSQRPTLGLAGLAEYVDPQAAQFRRDPARWAAEKGVELWSKQREILESVRDNKNTAVRSCHEIGKSFSAALTCCWFLDTHPPGETFVVTSAPTDKQVEAILWREINKMHAKMGLAGRTNLKEWYVGSELVAFGRKPADTDPTAFQGIHARHILVILDEACGMPKELWDAASTLGANAGGKMLAIGNPDDEHSHFATLVNNPAWHNIRVAYWDTPNFTGEPVSASLREMLIHPDWVEAKKLDWGEGSALFTSKCEGEFPRGTSPFTVIPVTWVEACQTLELPHQLPVEAGIDIGGGGDRTVVRLRYGHRLGPSFSFVDADPVRSTGQVARLLREHAVERVKIDSNGVGWGVYGALRSSSSRHNPTPASPMDITHDAEVIPVNFGEGPTLGKEHLFLNKRAEAYWYAREQIRLQLVDLAEVNDSAKQELSTPIYEILDAKGKVKIQSKADIIKLLGRSPDEADAIVYALWDVQSQGLVSNGADSLGDVNLLRDIEPTDWMSTPIGRDTYEPLNPVSLFH